MSTDTLNIIITHERALKTNLDHIHHKIINTSGKITANIIKRVTVKISRFNIFMSRKIIIWYECLIFSLIFMFLCNLGFTSYYAHLASMKAAQIKKRMVTGVKQTGHIWFSFLKWSHMSLKWNEGKIHFLVFWMKFGSEFVLWGFVLCEYWSCS